MMRAIPLRVTHRGLLGLAIAALTALAACTAPPPAAPPTTSAPNTAPISQADTTTAAAPRVGQPAPNFTGIDSNGKSHQLRDFKGKIVVLEWTNHDCPYVRKHYESGNMQALQKQATGKGVVWLSVVSSAAGQQGNVNGPQANDLTKSRGAAPTAVLLDATGQIGRLYEARTTPHMFVITPTGTLAYAGAIDSIASSDQADLTKAQNYVTLALDAVMQGKAVSPATTQPYGCSVKYSS